MGTTDDLQRLILYVEDDPDHAELVLRALAQLGTATEVVHLTDGDATVEYLDGLAANPDLRYPNLILLDLRLPKRSGLEVLERIRATAHLATLPVVFLTTSDAHSDIVRAYRGHANSYIVKPTDFGELTRTVQLLSTYWTNWNVTHR